MSLNLKRESTFSVTSTAQKTPTLSLKKLIWMVHESQAIIHSTLTENKDEDYDYSEEENSSHPGNALDSQEGSEFTL